MSSNINPYNIDGTFPIAGQDNSSQGFRDNFTNIKNNFLFAQNEINDLQSKAILTSALDGQSINNDMAGGIIRRPQLAAWTQSLLDLNVISNSAILDFNLANFQKITTAGPISVSFINWPTSTGIGALGYGSMRVWFVVTDVAHSIILDPKVTIGVDDIAGYNMGTGAISFDAPGNYVFDFSSIDGGNNFLIFDVTRNRATLRDPDLYFNAQVNSTLLIGYGPELLPVALQLEQGADKVSTLGSYNSVSASTSYTGNVAFTQGDSGPTAGYSVTGIRANLSTGDFFGIQNNDFVGYVNALTFTGDGAGGNAVTALGSIAFYARGTNVANGLGGNVTIWTTPDGTGSTPFVAQQQAVGIENDQSVHFFGATTTDGNATITGNATVSGTLKTNGGIVNNGTYKVAFLTSGGSTFTANSAVSTVIIDSTGSSACSTGIIVLPTNPVDRQTFRISAVAPITSANVYNPTGTHSVKYVPSNTFASGNVSVYLTYIASETTWFRS